MNLLLNIFVQKRAFIQGELIQIVERGSYATSVTIRVNEGYRFIRWSDGETDIIRNDTNIQDDLKITAIVEKIYHLKYQLNINDAGKIIGDKEQALTKLDSSSLIELKVNGNYRFIGWSDGVTSLKRVNDKITKNTQITAIFEYLKYDLPVLTINTKKPIVSKEEYVSMDLSISNTSTEYLLHHITGNIRGRGNSTWPMPKKPYRIKFEEKQSLFGEGSAKNWTLIANYCDKSLIRSYLAYQLSDKLPHIEYTTSTKFVELVLNGKYEGVYLLCDQIEVGKTRVNIAEKSSDINTGYLVELDHWGINEGVIDVDYFYSWGIPYTLKSPKTDEDYYSVEQLKYIKDYLDKAMNFISSKNFKQIQQYIDVDSFVDTYIIQELFKNVDAGHSSFYLYKDVNGVLKSGPIWDFDISSGNCDYSDSDIPTGIRTRRVNIWYNKLMDVPEFYNLVVKRYKEYQTQIQEIIDMCDQILIDYEDAFNRNFERWPILDEYVWPNTLEIVKCNSVRKQIKYLQDWLETRNNWLKKYFNIA